MPVVLKVLSTSVGPEGNEDRALNSRCRQVGI